MRKEPFSEGNVVHVIKRGARGLDIFLDDSERWQFINSLYILNDEYHCDNWRKETITLGLFERPKHWPERKTITRILAWVILPNHIHLLVQESKKGGVSKFMQRICGSMTLAFNAKHKSQGSIFQGAYKAKRVDGDDYLRYLMFYILIKNTLEQYPGGLKVALSEFDKAWSWMVSHPFSSLRSSLLGTESPVIDDPEGFVRSFITSNNFSKNEIFEMLGGYLTKDLSKSDLQKTVDKEQVRLAKKWG